MMFRKWIPRSLLGEVQILIVLLSMVIMIVVVAASVMYLSSSTLNNLRQRAGNTADELEALLELPLYNVDNELSNRIARSFLSSGRISGIELRSTANGILISDLSGHDSSGIPRITRAISANGLPLGEFTISFSDAEVRKSRTFFILNSLAIIISVLLANIAASRLIGRRVRKPFLTIFAAIEKLAAGNYQAQIEPTRYRDINILIAHFNDMAAKIHGKNQEQKRIEDQLIAERQFLIDIIDFLPDATFIIDNDRRVVVWNRAAEAMTGVARERLIGKGDFVYAEPFFGRRQPILIDLLDLPQHETAKIYKYVKRTESAIYAESFIPRLNDGQGMHLWGVAAPIFDRTDRRVGAIEMIRDVTDLKRAEEEKIHLQEQLVQTQKMESIGRLAGGVAHDFNNMLTIILGHAQLAILCLADTDPAAAHLKIIEDTSRRSTDLVRQLLAFARKQTASPRALDLNEAVGGTLTMLQRLIGEDVTIDWSPSGNLWQVWIDPSQVDQLLMNLCVNARDAIDGIGKITLSTANVVVDTEYCRSNAESRPGEYAMLVISDNGCGMDKVTLDHMYEPFFTTKAVGKGTGMGLATVYGIIKQNNGFINVYSEPGRGTTFKLYIPRCTSDSDNLAETSARQEMAGGGETVLVVEDDAIILGICRDMLEKLGYRVLLASTPLQALEMIRNAQTAIHLLMTDVIMPEMHGRDLEMTATEIDPDLKCLFISGYPAEVIAHHGILDQDVYFLQKPFALRELGRAVRQALSRTPRSDQAQSGLQEIPAPRDPC